MKICDIVQFYSPLSGGVKRYISDKTEYLRGRAGFSHVVVVPGRSDSVRTERGATIYEIESPSLIGSHSYRMLLSRSGIKRVLESERPDVVEVGDPYRSAWLVAGLARHMRIPAVAFYHSDYPRDLSRTLERFTGSSIAGVFGRIVAKYLLELYRRMDVTVVATKRLLSVLSEMGIPRLVHIPLGTNPEVFYPRGNRDEVLREFGLRGDTKLLLFVGRLAREKNVKELVVMLDHLPKAIKCHLLIVGDGERRQLVRRENGRRENMSWVSYCADRERLAMYYSAADIFICPGVSETFGLASLEAQACGTRALIVKGGGADETLSGEEPLVMAEGSDGKALADGVARALGIREDDGTRLLRHRRIANSFSLRTTFDNLTSVYERLCGNRRVSPGT